MILRWYIPRRVLATILLGPLETVYILKFHTEIKKINAKLHKIKITRLSTQTDYFILSTSCHLLFDYQPDL